MDQENAPHSAQDGKPAFDPLIQVRAYWEGLRDGGGIPFRTQISPRGIETALSSTFLIERVAVGMARFRIAGLDLTDIMGMEVRGMPLSALFNVEARTALAGHLEQVFAGPAVLNMDLCAGAALARPALTARFLALPLCDDSGRTTLALGCLALTGGIGLSPRRFDIGLATATSLEPSLAAPKPNSASVHGFAPHLVPVEKAQAFAEPATAFDGPAKTKPYLRLVD